MGAGVVLVGLLDLAEELLFGDGQVSFVVGSLEVSVGR